jgi:predicted short-subunit dehydrogenase-like oxidoreductase (DUF2520 family)
MKPSFAIVGCGKLGTALGKYLSGAGYQCAGFASKSLTSAKNAAETAGSEIFSKIPWEITKNADVVFLTTPDGLIADTCTRISKNNGFRKDSIVLHCSGAHPSTILSSAKVCNAWTGSLHPLQSFASPVLSGNPFKDIIMSVEGESAAVDTGKAIANDLGANCLTIKTEAKTLYHASAVVASNYLVALFDLAFRLIGQAGISDRNAFDVLKPLVQGTLSNIEKEGIEKALTGPISRGDVETVERHLKEISSKAPELVNIYKILGLHTVGIAQTAGTLPEVTAKELEDVLKQNKFEVS